MPIYDIFEQDPMLKGSAPHAPKLEAPAESMRDRFFSFMAARMFFLVLLVVVFLWVAVALIRLTAIFLAYALTLCKSPFFTAHMGKASVSLRRAVVCGLSLVVSIFSPAFGIMVACTYFLMYDKTGIEEVVPRSLQEQFKEFFRSKKEF